MVSAVHWAHGIGTASACHASNKSQVVTYIFHCVLSDIEHLLCWMYHLMFKIRANIR